MVLAREVGQAVQPQPLHVRSGPVHQPMQRMRVVASHALRDLGVLEIQPMAKRVPRLLFREVEFLHQDPDALQIIGPT